MDYEMIFLGLLMMAAGVFALGIYFLPTIIALFRAYRFGWPIFFVNLFFGWTLIGWVGALVWATMPKRKGRS
jgi:hypothetical protein